MNYKIILALMLICTTFVSAAMIDGTVVDINDHPVSWANVMLYDVTLDEVAGGMPIDETGYYHFGPLELHDYRIDVNKTNFELESYSFTISAEDQNVIHDFVLTNSAGTYTLSGYVFDDGTSLGIEDAEVEIMQVENYENFYFTETDADGFYSISGLVEGEYEVRITADGYVSQEIRGGYGQLPFEVYSDVDEDFYLEELGDLTIGIVGYVIDANTEAGLDNYHVEVCKETKLTTPSCMQTQTDDGFYVLNLNSSEFGAGTYFVMVHTPPDSNYVSFEERDVVISEDQVLDKNISLGLGSKIYVSIFDSGNLQDESTISMVEVYGQAGYSNAFKANDQKIWELNGLSIGEYELNIRSQPGINFVADVEDVSITEEGEEVFVSVNLDQGASYQGFVLDENDDPIENIEVTLFFQDQHGGIGWPAGNYFITTDQDGFYTLSGVTPGESYNIVANSMGMYGFSTGVTEAPVISAGETEDVNIVLSTAGKITGRVVNDSNVGIAGVFVDAHNFNAFGFSQTDGDGYFTVSGLPDGEFKLMVMSDGTYTNKSLKGVEVLSGEETDVGNIQLSQGSIIRGYVLEGGVPKEDIALNAYKAFDHHKGPGTDFDPSGFGWAVTDAQGFYEIKGLGSGDYIVEIDPFAPDNQGYKTERIEVEIASLGQTVTDINFSLETGKMINGYILDSNDDPVTNVFVHAHVPPQNFNEEPTSFGGTYVDSTDGYYEISGLSEGVHKVIVEVDSFMQESSLSSASADVNVNAASVSKNFTLTTGGTIIGKVVDSNGDPIAFSQVFAEKEKKKHGEDYFRPPVMTREDGIFKMGGLKAADDYLLFVEPSYDQAYAGKVLIGVKVSAGETTDLDDITLVTGGSIDVTVEVDDTPISNVEVRAHATDGTAANFCFTDENGECELTNLPENNYFIEAHFWMSGQDLAPKFDEYSLTSSLGSYTFDLTSTVVSVSGFIVDSDGDVVANAEIGMHSYTAKTGDFAEANGSGEYTLSKLKPDQTYTVFSSMPGYDVNVFQYTVDSDDVTDFNIILSSFEEIGTLYDVSGTVTEDSVAAVGKVVTILDVAYPERQLSTVTDENGDYTFEVPGTENGITYKVVAGYEIENKKSKKVIVTDSDKADVDIVITTS